MADQTQNLSAYAKWQLDNLEKRETAEERAARVQGYQQSSLFRTHDRSADKQSSSISSTTKDSYIRHAPLGSDPSLVVTPDLELRKSHWSAGGGSYNPDPGQNWTTTSRSAQSDLVAARAAGSVTRARPTQDPWASSAGSSLTDVNAPQGPGAEQGPAQSTSQAMYTVPDAEARKDTLAWRKAAKDTNKKLQATSNWTASGSNHNASWESTTRAATKVSAEALRNGSRKDWTADATKQDPYVSSINGVFKMETKEEEAAHFESLKSVDAIGSIPKDYVAENVSKSKELKADLQASHFNPCDYVGQTYQTESGAAYAAPPADLLSMSRKIAAERRTTKDLNCNPYATHIPGWRTQTLESRAGPHAGAPVNNDSLDDWDERRTIPTSTTARDAFVKHDPAAGRSSHNAKAMADIAADLRTSHIGTALGNKTSVTPQTTAQAAFSERSGEKPVSRAAQKAVAAAYRAEYQGTHFKLDDGLSSQEELASRAASGYRAEYHSHDFSAAQAKEAREIKEDLRRTHYVLGYSGRDGKPPTASRHDFRKYSAEEQSQVRGVSVKPALWASSAGTSSLAYEEGLPSSKWASDGQNAYREFSASEQAAHRGVSVANSEHNGSQALQKTHFRLGDRSTTFETTSGAGYRAPKALVDNHKQVIRSKDAEPPKRAAAARRTRPGEVV